MVEGHGVHRVCRALNGALAGRAWQASSPNGRFKDGAAAISGKTCRKLEAIGKNLFAFFDGGHVVHVHFGMSGRWAIFDRAKAPEPTPTTRLRLEDERVVTHLSAMTVALGGEDLFAEKRAALGQDPLREDADPAALWEKLHGSRKSIGLLLMDQGFFAGVGNIYRAEILFKAGVHPNRPANSISREDFDRIWMHSADLLQRGFKMGSILTVDKDEAIKLRRPAMRRYIYNQSRCGRCRGQVLSWNMANRTCYACEACQPRSADTPAVEGAREPTLFQSKCATDSLQDRLQTPEKLNLAELRAALEERGLSSKGAKKSLVARLAAATATDVFPAESPKFGAEVATANESPMVKAEVATANNPQSEEVEAVLRPIQMKVAELRAELAGRGLPTHGRKRDLVERLEAASPLSSRGAVVNSAIELALEKEAAEAQEADLVAAAAAQKRTKGRAKSEPRTGRRPKTGTKHLGKVRSAAEAALEKAAAGEGRNVEHVAELDLRSEAGAEEGGSSTVQPGRRRSARRPRSNSQPAGSAAVKRAKRSR